MDGRLAAAFLTAVALSACGGNVADDRVTDAGGGAADAPFADVTTPETGADAGFDADASTGDARDGDACSGLTTSDFTSESAAHQICPPPNCEVCVQTVDSRGQPTQWMAWQVPDTCACPPPQKAIGDAGFD